MSRVFTEEGDAAKRKALGDLDKDKDQEATSDLQAVMSTYVGRRFVSWIIHELCHTRDQGWLRAKDIKAGDSAFAHMAYFAGVQRTGQHLEELVDKLCPENADAMESERRARTRMVKHIEKSNQPGEQNE